MATVAILLNIAFHRNNDYNSNNIYSTGNKNTIKIGALLGLSGSSYESGLIQKKIFEQARHDANENLSKSNSSKRIELQIANTEINPDIALEKTKELVNNGVKIIIGPQTSDELKKIKPYVDSHDVLIISQSMYCAIIGNTRQYLSVTTK